MALLVACQAEAPEPTFATAQATTAIPATATATHETNPVDATGGEAVAATVTVDETPVEETRTANADVEFVRAAQQADGSWRFDVTVRHPDTGWEDYADGWDVVTPDGRVLKAGEDDPFTRLLLHPHENEQPFTRSQSGIVVPDGVTVVVVRAHDLVDGFGGREVEVDLTADRGPGFEVSRP